MSQGLAICARILFSCLLLAVAISGLPPAVAEDPLPSRPQIDKSLGEEEEIRLRREWFFSTRSAGTTSAGEISSLRATGVEELRQLLAAQGEKRAAGFEGGQNFWVSKGPSPSTFGGWAFGNISGRIQAIAKDFASGTLYVGAGGGGVWKSTNDGLSWTSIFDTAGTVGVGAVAVDPNDPDVLWVGTGDNISGCESYFGIGLLRSPDGGDTWEVRNGSGGNTLDDLASFGSVIVDPRDSDHLVVGGRWRDCSGSQEDAGIYTTDDGGFNWTNRLDNTEVHEIVQDPSVMSIYWAATDAGIYKSIDDGASWVQQNNSGLPSGATSRTEIAISPSNSDVVYALFSDPRGFWRTQDGGATWAQMSSGSSACDGQCSYNMTIRVDATNPDIVYRGTILVFRSVNGGSSWSALTSGWGSSQKVHQDIHALLVDPTQPDTFYVSGDGGIWKSENAGSSFSNLNGNLNITQFYAIGVDANDPERICGGAQDNSSLARAGDDDVWDRQAVTGDGFVCAINADNPNIAYITSYPSGGYPNIWRSTSGLFGSFLDVSGSGRGITGGDRINWVTPYILDPVTPSTLYVGTHRVYRSDNNGDLWFQVGPNDLTNGSSSLTSLEINRTHPDVLYSGAASGRVWRSENGGLDWTDLSSGLPSRTVNDVAGDPTDPDHAFAVVGGFNSSHVWEWNAGLGWTEHDGGLPNVPHNTVLMFSATDIVVGNDVGIFRSLDGGETFTPFMDGLPIGVVVTDLKFSPTQNVLTAGTYGRGAWQLNLGPPEPFLAFDSVEQPMIEIDGDGDAAIEPGETWSVKPILRNSGGGDADGVTALLTTSTPGVTILQGQGTYGDIGAGETAPEASGHTIVVDPSFACGTDIVFDLVNLSSTNPASFPDLTGAFTIVVRDADLNPVPQNIYQEDFDPEPADDWDHQAVDPLLAGCNFSFVDQWQILSKDGAHGNSFHVGSGPGGFYSRINFAWLYPYGKDSLNGEGIVIPDEAIGATLTLVHWYDTTALQDGGQVLIDADDNGTDFYQALEPAGGYPGQNLINGACNGLGGQEAFQGSSGGWVTDTFNLTAYAGEKIHLAFVFGSDRNGAAGEGWYIDEVLLDLEMPGPALCDIARWPGEVSANAQFNWLGSDTIEADWGDACNAGSFPEQTYSIQVGDLDGLHASGSYSHAPADSACDRTATSTFTAGPGNEYYLIVPSGEGREGSAGADSAGGSRPQTSGECGIRRVECP